ncbi:MAG: FdhF/YdeP family oxidoreductase [Dehalococcoidia bacterium]|nr:FdhF/YdeP family oxidoreductase [Dehalococcoidia bacterium]
MAKPRVSAGGGFPAIVYTVRGALRSGAPIEFVRRMRSRNTCKTCALGMGGQLGGMVNEAGHFPEFCKKSVQAQVGDMQGAISEALFRDTSIAELAQLSSAQFERLGRLAFPVVADEGDTHFRRIGWDEALARAASALRATAPGRVFFYSSGRSSNEAAFLLQLVARAYGSPHIHNCSFYCHNASGVALTEVYGSGTASVSLADLAQADLAIVAGANPGSNHPRLITQLVALRRRGGAVIVVNPLRELGLERFRIPSDMRSLALGSVVSDVYLQPHIGGDVALSKALLKAVIERGGVDEPFVEAHTAGWDAVRADAVRADWDALVVASGVPRADIDAAARLIVGAQRGIVAWAMGLTHHAHGVDNVLALTNLALARGWLGQPGAGLLPIRGHSNVQGVGSMGLSPVLKDAFARALEAAYGITVPREPGLDTYGSMLAAERGEIDAALLLGGNLFASNPDRAWAGAALRRVPLTVSLTTKLNEGHVHGRGRSALILPVRARDEEDQATTQESMFNFVRLSDGGRPAIAGELRSEVDVLAELAERVLPAGRFDWPALRSHRSLREAIARVVPGYAAAAAIDETRREFEVGGRAFRDARFATADGRAHFAVTPLPDEPLASGEFRLMTVRSEGQFNTVVYEEEDLYRGNRRRDVVMMAVEDAQRLGVAEGDPVEVASAVGSLRVVVALAPIRAGNLAMYYPEANVLVPRRLDPRSRTPAFKSVVVRVRRLDGWAESAPASTHGSERAP